MRIKRQRSQPGIVDGAADGEVVVAVPAKVYFLKNKTFTLQTCRPAGNL
jgi:hypothetical protein